MARRNSAQIAPGETHAIALARLQDALAQVALAAARAGVTYCIEPLSPQGNRT